LALARANANSVITLAASRFCRFPKPKFYIATFRLKKQNSGGKWRKIYKIDQK
jgi:hypothetical protein